MEHPLDIDEREYALRFLWSLDVMRREKKDCDLVIKVGNEEIPVHRNVMRAQSDYFDAMFTHDTFESQSGVVEMKDVKFEPVKKCVDFFYTGKISTSDDGCEDLLYTASMMQITPVRDQLGRFLQSRLNPKSFFNIRKIASKFDLQNLMRVCDKFALMKLDLIAQEDEFNQLEMQYVAQLVISKRSSYSGSEDAKLAIVLQWIKADVKSRNGYLVQMMRLVDPMKISPGCAKFIIENESLANKSTDVMKMIFPALLRNLDVHSKPPAIHFGSPTEPDTIVVFDMSSSSLQAYHPLSNTWRKIHSLLRTMRGSPIYTAVIFEGFIFVLMSGKKVYRINVTQQRPMWTPVENMLNNHAAGIRCTVHDRFIYVAGENSMERYCPSRNEWEEVNTDGIPCNNCALATCDGNIYSIGGYHNQSLNNMNKFEPDLSMWSSLSHMHMARQNPSAIAYGDKIYVAGGYNGGVLNDVEFYDIGTETWTMLPPMIEARSRFGLCFAENKLFAIGRYQEECTIESFDFDRNCWSILTQKPEMNTMARASVALLFPL